LFYADLLIHSQSGTSELVQNQASETRSAITPDAFTSVDNPTQLCQETNQFANESYFPPLPTEADLIEAKRRHSTIAARRSRRRKLAYLRELEESVVWLREQSDHWKARKVTYETILKRHGLEVPECDLTEEQRHADAFEHKDQIADESNVLHSTKTKIQVERSQRLNLLRKLEDDNGGYK
jgi:hypothetical protein